MMKRPCRLCVIVFVMPAVAIATYCEDLGYFEPEGPFVDFPDPTCPGDETLDLLFTMFTSPSDEGEDFNRNTIPNNFNNGWNTVFIVHGWYKDGNTTWLYEIKDRLVEKFSVNAVVVGWGGEGGAENINYTEVASTTRTVGAETAEVMMNLILNGGGDEGRMHCVGSSLGAHVCGHMGRWAADRGHKPDRITGMDPAGPRFVTNPDRTVGLWYDCAEFVDIIHTTNTLGSTPDPGGDNLTLGHQDFYPNNGDIQPGCPTDNCGHTRAREFFLESIGVDCFVAREKCISSGDLPDSCNSCGGICALMGYGASRDYGSGIYRLDTSSSSPFCLG